MISVYLLCQDIINFNLWKKKAYSSGRSCACVLMYIFSPAVLLIAVLCFSSAESIGDPHWFYCSHFVLYSLSHINNLLEHVGEKGCFLNEELRQARGIVNALLKKAEIVSQKHTSQRSAPSLLQLLLL